MVDSLFTAGCPLFQMVERHNLNYLIQEAKGTRRYKGQTRSGTNGMYANSSGDLSCTPSCSFRLTFFVSSECESVYHIEYTNNSIIRYKSNLYTKRIENLLWLLAFQRNGIIAVAFCSPNWSLIFLEKKKSKSCNVTCTHYKQH